MMALPAQKAPPNPIAWAMLRMRPEDLPAPVAAPQTPQTMRLNRLRQIHEYMNIGPMFLSSKSNQTLAIGPLLPEFGHELFVAAMARYRAQSYKGTVVCTRKGREALWTDFAKVIPHDMDCESSVVSPRNFADVPEDKLAFWRQMVCGAPFPVCEYFSGMKGIAKFIIYGHADEKYDGVTVIHARSRNHVHARNWPIINWTKLVAGMREKGLADRVVCIGSPGGSLLVPGCEDRRGVSLQGQMNILRSARMAVGPSSGPMHLASLCLCPHVVWCGGARAEHTAVVARYKVHWNPHGTSVMAMPYNSWRPEPGRVIEWVEAFAETLP